jgi:hypothetical protein
MLATLIFATVSIFAAVPTDATKNPLQPLDFLVGSCWAGDFPNGMGRDTHCFEPVYGGKFVRDRHVLHGKKSDYSGESIYVWDPKQQHIVFWYWSSDGDIDQGSVEPVADGLYFPERHLTQPQDLIMRTHWHHIDADRYEAINERKNGDAWQTEWKIEYRRVATPKGGTAKSGAE